MSVKLIDNECFYGYRARRRFDGKNYQEYFSLKKDRERLTGCAMTAVKQAAAERDVVLAKLQVAAKKRNRIKHYFLASGHIKGINAIIKVERSGAITPVYRIGIHSEKEGKSVTTSVSLNKLGQQAAWADITAKFAKHKCLRKNSKLYDKVMAAAPPAFPA